MRLLGKPEGLEVEIEPLAEFYAAHTIFTFRDGLIYRENRENLLPLQDFLSCLPELAGTGFYVEKNDIPTFCRELLPLLEKHYHCERTAFNEADYGVEPVSFEIYLDAPQRNFITCKVYAVYGDKKYEVYKKDGRTGRPGCRQGNTDRQYRRLLLQCL